MHYLGKFEGKSIMAAENYFSVDREVKPAESAESSDTDQSLGKYRKYIEPCQTALYCFVETPQTKNFSFVDFVIMWSCFVKNK